MGKILIVSCVFPPEPVVSATLSFDIAEKLSAMGKEVVVVCPKPSRPLNYVFDNSKRNYPFELTVLSSYVCPESQIIGRSRESYSFGQAIKKFVKNYPHPIDAIYANTWPLFSQRALAQIAMKRRIPYFIHVQDIYPESYCSKMPKVLGRLLYKALLPFDVFVLKHAAKIITISPSMISHLSSSRQIPSDRFILARNWQNDSSFIQQHTPLTAHPGACHVMYLGNINPTANVALIVRAMSKLDKGKYHLSLIGNGPDKDHCQELGRELGLDITFGAVNPSEVPSKQAEADILVLCLKKGVAKTATPSKLTAYMLTGRPIIASVDTDSDCANIVRSTGCGLVVEPDNEEMLREAIVKLTEAHSEEERLQMGNAAFDYAKKHLSKEANLTTITNAITSVL